MNTEYNDFKTYTVSGNETVQDICMANNISESDLVQANPQIPLASYGGVFFSSEKYKLDIKPGDVLKIPFYNEEKDKKGVKTIKGNNTVKVGVWENYEVTDWFEGTPEEDRNEEKVKWDLYYMQNGTKPELVLQKEEGKIRFQEKAVGNKYKVVAYLDEPNLNNGSALLLNVETSEKKEILSIKITDVNNKPINGKLSYGQIINVHVETTGMKGEYIDISLWEDDAKGEGHSDDNKYNEVDKKEKVLIGNNGVAHTQFTLKPDFKKIANAHLSKGDSSEGSEHEYYVTAYASGESKASPNINVRNPDYKEKKNTETQDHLKGSKPKPSAPDYKGPAKKEQPKPATSDQTGISAIYITDDKGVKLTKSAYGKTIRVYVASKGLKNKKVRLWLYEHDTFDSNDELYSKDIIITSDLCYDNIKLTEKMQTKGNEYELGEGSSQELFARAKVMDVPAHIISKSLKADVTSTVVDVAESTTVAKVADSKVEAPKGNSCGEKFCIKKGDKSELIREINIRLAGFGGNVPTDVFTDRTEKMIKQFQRDFMKVPETGKVCGNVLLAIDQFQAKYNFDFSSLKCKCGTCTGFGDKSNKGKYLKGNLEAHHRYEYPGIHRSLLWSLRAVIFYLGKDGRYSLNKVNSGYRCRYHEEYLKKPTTNHMGKALDLHFNKNGARTRVVSDIETIREDVFNKYLGAKWDWKNEKDIFYLESTAVGATTWVHYDVREFNPENYLQDKFFVKTLADLNGKGIVQLAKELGFQNTCNCITVMGASPKPKTETKKGGCFCDRELTNEDLVSLGISKKNADKFLESINSTLKEYNINSCKRKLHFLAQVRHESGEFVYQEEIASGKAYEGREDLGNTETGDGVKFKGRGLIQITGRKNYTSYGTYKGENFTTAPNNKKLGELPYCVDSAGWYWSKNLSIDLNDYADKDDVIYITYRINGGYNGYLDDRKPKLIEMIKAIDCEKTKFENYDSYSIKKSKSWDAHDAVYKYAKLNTSESKDSYKRFLELTEDYLTWTSMKGPKNKKKRENMEARRKLANEKSK